MISGVDLVAASLGRDVHHVERRRQTINGRSKSATPQRRPYGPKEEPSLVGRTPAFTRAKANQLTRLCCVERISEIRHRVAQRFE